MAKGKYLKTDLENRNDTPAEKNRLRAIYDDLVARGSAGIPLSAIEQAHVQAGLRFLGEPLGKYAFAEEGRFKEIYLTYFHDITGGSRYVKTDGRGNLRTVPQMERDSDLQYLIDEAEKWERLIQPGGHTDLLLQEATKEAKADRKTLDRLENIASRPGHSGTYYYKYKVWGLYLRSRWMYLLAKEILENTDPGDCFYQFCGETIEFTEFSLMHILNRHFAEVTKQFVSGKDYHPEDFKPRILTAQIKAIVDSIDKTGLFTPQVRTEINLKFEGTVYQLWATMQNRNIPGRGIVPYKRLQSFYPVSDPAVLAKLTTGFREETVSAVLSVFVPI
ncbi:MAG: hypothetical protein J7623_31395 [Chitinophaga sp.]|uniref:hypothetical protein n=1 Tax=Chitinophaga sp. TaxID=1869181 RepID=UPI001B099C83|nr:hypothetical protein [Chitinophaga sp.]MBO9733189.1 hypothetical protein [Chitinophaga sp.]